LVEEIWWRRKQLDLAGIQYWIRRARNRYPLENDAWFLDDIVPANERHPTSQQGGLWRSFVKLWFTICRLRKSNLATAKGLNQFDIVIEKKLLWLCSKCHLTGWFCISGLRKGSLAIVKGFNQFVGLTKKSVFFAHFETLSCSRGIPFSESVIRPSLQKISWHPETSSNPGIPNTCGYLHFLQSDFLETSRANSDIIPHIIISHTKGQKKFAVGGRVSFMDHDPGWLRTWLHLLYVYRVSLQAEKWRSVEFLKRLYLKAW
jgi:hypothetical protein